MPAVRIRLDFVIHTEGDHLPTMNVLDFIEAGVKAGVSGKTTEIAPGARVKITHAARQKRG